MGGESPVKGEGLLKKNNSVNFGLLPKKDVRGSLVHGVSQESKFFNRVGQGILLLEFGSVGQSELFETRVSNGKVV